MRESIINLINESVRTFTNISKDQHQVVLIEDITNTILNAFKSDNKLLLCGNGGSAADAQHIAAELSGRFEIDRKPINAEALHVNSSFVTAVANDYGYEEVYSRMVEAIGKNGDILLALSTSGNSKNVIRAIEKANSLGLITIGFSGNDGATESVMQFNYAFR